MQSLENISHPTYLPELNHHIVAFFEFSEELLKATSRLVNVGLHEEDFFVFEGPEGIEAVDLLGERHSYFEKYMRKFIQFSDAAEWRFLREADEELRKGRFLLVINMPSGTDKNHVVGALKAHHAYDIRLCSHISIEEVV